MPHRPLLHLMLLPIVLLAPAARASEITRSQDGVSVTYRDATDALDATMRERILTTFFHAYAQQRRDFNPAAPTQALITIDPGYDGIAFVGSDRWARMTINPGWLHKHPDDTDLVTHEAMHIVQGYPEYGNDASPAWLVEGIADYARDRYGIDNAAAGWALPREVKASQNYDTGYRVSGAFLKWAEARHAGLVKALDGALRAGRYTPALWSRHAGKPLPELWSDYVADRGGARAD